MKINEYQEMSKRTLPNEGINIVNILVFSLGLNGESGEVAEIIKKWVGHRHPLDAKKLKNEIGDVMFYLAGICSLLGYSLEECATMNIVKLQERYPNGFNSEDSIKRSDVKNYDLSSLYPSIMNGKRP